MSNSIFTTLNAINVNGHVEKKDTGKTQLSYLSWPWAWAEVKQRYPDASYTIERDEHNLTYFASPLGLIVYTSVTIDGLTHMMWLPVMDGANNAMKTEPYEIKGKYGTRQVAAATMFDVNKTIMRCLVKNLAMFGEGLYIYAGEDLPEDVSAAEADSASQKEAPVTPRRSYTRKAMTPSINSVPQPQPQPTYDRFAGIKAALQATTTVAELYQLYNQHKNEVDNNEAIRNLFTERKNQLTFNAA